MAPNGSERQSAAFHRRGKSLADHMTPLQGLDFGHLTIEDDEKRRDDVDRGGAAFDSYAANDRTWCAGSELLN